MNAPGSAGCWRLNWELIRIVGLLATTGLLHGCDEFAGITLHVEKVKVATRAPQKESPAFLQSRRKRVFVDKDVPRPGFRFPREDGRANDGDEIQLFSHSHKTWLSVVPEPAASTRGMVTMTSSISGQGCAVSGDDFVMKCNKGAAPLELRDAGWGGRVGIVSGGKLCTDTADAIRCKIKRIEKCCDGWEAFKIVDAGEGKVSLKGGRHDKFCADAGDGGVVCDQDTASGGGVFNLTTGRHPRLIVSQTKNKEQAATFVLGRSSQNASEVTLKCKGHGSYLSVDPKTKKVGCFSPKPTALLHARVDGQKWWNAVSGSFKDPETGKYFRAEHPHLGDYVDAKGNDLAGWQIFDFHLVAGYESVYPMVRGVNLGSWFLMEPWMIGSMFRDDSGAKFEDRCAAIDEYSLMQHLSDATKKDRMEQHWSTWITERDVEWLASHGINTVRVPFGYWMTHPEPPFVDGGFKYLEKLFEWCESNTVAVLLDFHGHKGSQNGKFTSGNCGGCGRSECGQTGTHWLEEQDTNLAVIANLTKRFSKSPAYLGFGVANEVSGGDSRATMVFYQKAYNIIREQSPNALVFLDATFNPSTYPFDGEWEMAMDDHIYFSARFNDDAGADHNDNMEKARERLMEGARWPVLVGEWALDHHGHELKNVTAAESEDWHRYFAKAQLQAYEQHTMGWIYWSYKTEYHNSTWNFRHLCEVGWLPGCKLGQDYGPEDWWDNQPCSFAYLDKKYLDSDCVMQDSPK